MILTHYISNSKSLITGEETVKILNLGLHGFADSFFEKEDLDIADQAFPLVCQLDTITGLVQTLNFSNPETRYGGVDYSYTSSNSQNARRHWGDFAQFLEKSSNNFDSSSILEIGSNDGYLLSLLKGKVGNLLGVDASPFMCQLANDSQIKTLNGVFGESINLDLSILEHDAKYDIIVANNVLNHSNDPVKFVEKVFTFLKENGTFVFEVPYWLETIKSLHFDQIYHEHVTYFTVKSIRHLLDSAQMHITNVEVVDYHGGSLRISARRRNFTESSEVMKYIKMEEDEGLFNIERYHKYFEDICAIRDSFLADLNQKREKIPQVRIFGVGAAAKANTLLTFYGFDSSRMEFIVDASPHKQGKFTPVTKIPILSDEAIQGISNGLGVVLAWNLSELVKEKLYLLNPELELILV
jgi:SAM-dependent methyltransferase